MKTGQEVVDAFHRHSLHDDTVHAIRIIPATSPRQESRIEIDLTDYASGKPRQLALTGCVVMALTADFVELADNAFANVNSVQAEGDEERTRAFIESQKSCRYLVYVTPSRDPALQRMKDVPSLVLFRVNLFGGTLEVAARGFKLSRPRVSARVGSKHAEPVDTVEG